MYRLVRMLGACLCAALLVAATPAAPAIHADDSAGGTVTLHLLPGLNGPWFGAQFQAQYTPAPNIPPGMMDVSAPLYPGAVPTTETESLPNFAIPLSPYLKSDWAAYLLPADLATAEAWYRQAFTASGWYTAGSGSTNDQKTGASSLQITFASTTMTTTDLSVELSLQADAQGRTIVDYEAIAITIPPRDPATLLPGDVERVDVTYRVTWASESPPPPPDLHAQVTAPSDVQALVTAFNALPLDGRSLALSCPVATADASLVFVEGNGRTVNATVDPACSRVIVAGEPLLQDLSGQLWAAVQKVMAPQLAALTPTVTPPATATPSAVPSATPTATTAMTTPTPPTPLSTATPQPTVRPAHAAFSLSVHLAQDSVVSGHVLVVRIHTAPYARLRLALQIPGSASRQRAALRAHGGGRRVVTLTTARGRADRRGGFTAYLRVAYRTTRPMRALLTVTARTSRGAATRQSWLTIRPASKQPARTS